MTDKLLQKRNLPRCPFCHHILEEVQLVLDAAPWDCEIAIWHEVWNCDSCNTNHVFPARPEFLELVNKSELLEAASRVLYLPRNVETVK